MKIAAGIWVVLLCRVIGPFSVATQEDSLSQSERNKLLMEACGYDSTTALEANVLEPETTVCFRAKNHSSITDGTTKCRAICSSHHRGGRPILRPRTPPRWRPEGMDIGRGSGDCWPRLSVTRVGRAASNQGQVARAGAAGAVLSSMAIPRVRLAPM